MKIDKPRKHAEQTTVQFWDICHQNTAEHYSEM